MQHRLVPVVAVVLLLAVPAPAHADEVTLDGVHARVGASTGQVVTVNRTSGFHARVTWWTRSDSGWVQRMQASDGRIGYGGLVRAPRRRQGTGTTPRDVPAAVGVRCACPQRRLVAALPAGPQG